MQNLVLSLLGLSVGLVLAVPQFVSMPNPRYPEVTQMGPGGPGPNSEHQPYTNEEGEVHQPIPPQGGHSPEGPHTHLLPKLLAERRVHPPGSPLPVGLYCGLSLYLGIS